MHFSMKKLMINLLAVLWAWVVIVPILLRNLSVEKHYNKAINSLERGSIVFDKLTTGEPQLPSAVPRVIVTNETVKKEEGGEILPTSCACKTAPLLYSNIYREQLSKPVSWRNMTSIQVQAKNHPNFPYSLFEHTDKEFCDLMPKLHTIAWAETYYQTMTVSNFSSIYLYSAFLDNRPLAETRPCIRILAYTKAKRPASPWCYTWFNTTGPPAVSQVIRKDYVDWQIRSTYRQMFFILTCPIPKTVAHLTPLAVSLVSRPCDKAQTLLQITGAMQRNDTTAYIGGNSAKTVNGIPQWSVAVCGPALFYYHEDISIRLVEWLELLRALGFARVFLLQTAVHPNVEKVLRYYEAEGFLGVTRFSYPESYVNEPNIRRLWILLERSKLFGLENMYFTDCLLRHMHEYRFISHFDPDEMPMLPKHDSFPLWLYERIRKAKSKKRITSYDLNWRYHHDDLEPTEDKSLPEYLWFLRHTKVSKKDVFKSLSKPTFDMDVVTGVFSHGALSCVYGRCFLRGNKCPRQVAYLGHYRRDCGEDCQIPDSVDDVPSLLKYKDEVSLAVQRTLVKLELI
ncbi:uncharacterized protein LOC122244346 [Penaeus japonicus]|uniref:uncharacterized protein LOC122244346 n=1 Tax=Penaeus japonicus TaxID=27405 RepID=UPI001C70C0C0|nr:uncharacterized protein LOC122244346 [Penaeus japonicus]